MRRLAYLVALSLMVMPILVPSAGAQGGQQTATVSIGDFYFSPAQLTVEQGTTVRWVNEGRVPHNVTSTDGGPLASEILQPGSAYQYTFQNPGTYAYYCAIHPAMTASVTVTAGGGAATVQEGEATQTAAQPSEDAEQTPLTEQLFSGGWSTVALIVAALLGVVVGALFGWAFRGAWTFRPR